MRIKSWSMFGIFALLLSIIVLSGCEESSSPNDTNGTKDTNDPDTVTIEYLFWGNQSEINTIMETIDKFNETRDDIQVKGTGMDPSVYLQKLSSYASSNTMPDIVQVAVDYGDTYVKRDVFEPLDNLIEGAGIKSLVGDNMWEGLSYEGDVYAVPIQASAPLLVANKDLFEEIGIEVPTEEWTEEEFRDAAIKLTDSEKKQYGIIYGGAITDWPRALYGSEEYHVYDWDNNEMNAENNSAFKHSLDLLVNDLMIDNQAAPTALNSKDIGGGFETGNYGMAMIGFWDLFEINKVVQDSFDWDVIPFPTNSEYGQWKTVMFANALSVSATSDHKDAAFEYIKWVLEDEDVQKESVSLPVNLEVLSDAEFLNTFGEDEKDYNKQLAIDALNNSVPWRNAGVISEINSNVINPEIESLILNPNSTDIDTVLKNIQEEGQKVFDSSED